MPAAHGSCQLTRSPKSVPEYPQRSTTLNPVSQRSLEPIAKRAA